MSDLHRQQSSRLMEESVSGTTNLKEPFEQKSLDSFVPESEGEFVEYAELISRKLRSFEKDHHYVAFLKAMNELTLGDMNAADAEEVASSVSVIAQKKREQNTDTHMKKHLHRDGSVFKRLFFWWCRKSIDLPENLLFEILTRLPAKDVLRCRLVCRKWREVTLTPYFIGKHAERAPEALIFHEVTPSQSVKFFVFGESKNKPLIDKEFESSIHRNFMRRESKKKSLIDEEVESREYSFMNLLHSKSIQSCNGLLLGTTLPGLEISICNPFTGDELLLRILTFSIVVYGFFFHPDNGDYRVLGGCGREDGEIMYLIFELGTRSWRSLNKTFPYAPNPYNSHVMANRSLHWKAVQEPLSRWATPCCNEFIITFNIDAEEFGLRSHPGEVGCSDEMHKKMHLMEGQKDTLLFGQVFDDTMTLLVWSLEVSNYAGWIWERKHRIDLKWKVFEKPFPRRNESVRPVCIQGDELLTIWEERGLFLYHLKLGTAKKVEIRSPNASFKTYSYAGIYKETLVSFEGGRSHDNINPLRAYCLAHGLIL